MISALPKPCENQVAKKKKKKKPCETMRNYKLRICEILRNIAKHCETIRPLVPGCQYEFRVGAFGLHDMLSVQMRFMHSIFGRPELSFDATGRALPVARTPGTCPLCWVALCRSTGRHPHLLQDSRGASGAHAYGARDAKAPQALRQDLQVPVWPLLCRLPLPS